MSETKQSLHSANSKKPATRSSSKSPSKKKTTKSKGKLKKSRARSSSPAKKPIDLLSKPVMENAYYISHNAPQFLMYRGFSWESGGKSKEKGKKKKKGKKK